MALNYLNGFMSAQGGDVYPYPIEYSALFDGTTDYLSFTPSSTGDRRTWTFKAGLKPSITSGSTRALLGSYSDGSNNTRIWIDSGQQLSFRAQVGGTTYQVEADPLVTDYTGHLDVTVRVDTTQSTESDRVIIEFNGDVVPVTRTGTITQNLEFNLFSSGVAIELGRGGTSSLYYNGYLEDFYLIDGTALAASTWGEFSDLVTGLWIPKNPGSLTYGTNGCHLDFSNDSDLGEDSSGNGNDWTVAGSPAQTVDTPTDNYATWNSLFYNTYFSYSGGNRTVYAAEGTAQYDVAGVTLVPKSGKFYIEYATDATLTTNFEARFGLHDADTIAAHQGTSQINYDPHVYLSVTGSGWIIVADGVTVQSDSTPTFSAGDTVGVAFDCDAATVQFYDDDGNAIGTAVSTTIKNWMVCTQLHASGSSRGAGGTLNAAEVDWKNSAPSSFLALNTTNLPNPTILKSSTVSDIVLREGTGAEATISSLEFQPDFVNTKDRDNSRSWALADSENLATNYLATDTTAALAADAQSLKSFDAAGYTLGTSSVMNHSGASFIDLCLKAGVDQGFEVVPYTGTGVARTVSHNLGKVPTFMIVKNLDAADSWQIYHTALGATKYLEFDNGVAATDSGRWNDTAPTSTVFSIGADNEVNTSGEDYIAYLFTDSDIFKAFSYTGNSSADGPFVNLGGRPLSIPFLKNTDYGPTSWLNKDAVRDPLNPGEDVLFPDGANAETSDAVYGVNHTSQGFKVTGTGRVINGTAELYVGLAIMQSAAKYSNAF